MSFPDPVARMVKVSVKKSSGGTWLNTKPLPILSPMSYIVFEVAQVDRRDSVVPYLIYDETVQPYWKSLIQLPAVRNGCRALEMTVVLQPKEIPIAILLQSFSTKLDPLTKTTPTSLTKRSRITLPILKMHATWTWNV